MVKINLTTVDNIFGKGQKEESTLQIQDSGFWHKKEAQREKSFKTIFSQPERKKVTIPTQAKH